MTKFSKKMDKIAIIAPAAGCKDANDILRDRIKLLEEHGFTCKYYNKIFNGGALRYFSADRQIRLQHLKMAIQDKDVKIIWAFRGGFGSAEIAFECLNLKPSGPKILIGYSDITILFKLFSQHYNMLSIHGSSLSGNPSMIEPVISVLKGQAIVFDILQINVSNNIKSIEGPIAGGNLSVLCDMIGTDLHPDTKKKILFLEDNIDGKEQNRIHRNLTHMKYANLFQNVRAVIFCDFTNANKNLELLISYFCKEYISNIPTFRIKGIGHGEVNHPIIIGGEAIIKEGKLIVANPFGTAHESVNIVDS
jgi:muramoyltetrapeptide carboxypeptidase LdcA involved in peptidoglycan recycling